MDWQDADLQLGCVATESALAGMTRKKTSIATVTYGKGAFRIVA